MKLSNQLKDYGETRNQFLYEKSANNLFMVSRKPVFFAVMIGIALVVTNIVNVFARGSA